jgi:parallel beta-helix repeat protein
VNKIIITICSLVFILSLSFLFLSSKPVEKLGVGGTIYYVSNAGDDGNTGLSDGQAWATIDKVSSAVLNPDDIVLFKRGDTFHNVSNNPLYTFSAGTLGHPITFSAYGTGARPIIDGQGTSENVGFFLTDYITVSDLRFTGATLAGGVAVYLQNTTSTILDNLEIDNNGAIGIGGLPVKDMIIKNCIIHDNGNQGIYIGQSDNGLIESNTVYANSKTKDDSFGIDTIIPTGPNIIRYNIVHDQAIITDPSLFVCGASACGNGGIRLNGDGDDSNNTTMYGNEVYRNLIYNEDQGIQLVNYSGGDVYNNTIFNTRMYGAILMAQPGYGISSNNIFINNIIQASTSQTIIASLNNTDSVVNYNLYYPIDSQFIWTSDVNWTPGGLSKTSFATWKTNSGYDANSINNTPGFISNTDWELLSTSNAVDNGTTTTSIVDIVGRPISGLFDIGAYEYQPETTNNIQFNSSVIIKGNTTIK